MIELNIVQKLLKQSNRESHLVPEFVLFKNICEPEKNPQENNLLNTMTHECNSDEQLNLAESVNLSLLTRGSLTTRMHFRVESFDGDGGNECLV